jgi:acyl dehydratase
MPEVFTSIEDLRSALGREIGPSDPVTIGQERINEFADATGDHQWIHVDTERAAAGPYGATIAHGYLTLSLLPMFAQNLYQLEFGSSRINYGSNKVRFPSPVPVGSILRATSTFVDLSEGAGSFVLTTKFVVTADGAAKPACVAETLTVLVP